MNVFFNFKYITYKVNFLKKSFKIKLQMLEAHLQGINVCIFFDTSFIAAIILGDLSVTTAIIIILNWSRKLKISKTIELALSNTGSEFRMIRSY